LQRVRIALALLVVGAVGVAAPFAIAAISAGSSSSKVVTIKVTATEFKFALSKRTVPKGTTVIFKVTNKGKIEHDFKVAGKKTKLLKPGQSATLKVVFKKKGKFGYICTVKGHAAVGMKGTFGVGVTPPRVTTTQTTTTATTTTATTTTTPTSCTSPTSTVTVSMVEYAFVVNGVRNGGSVPAGCIQFNIKNDGQVVHNFNIIGVKAGALLSNGASETWNVQLTPGIKNYTCDVPFHDSFGMSGQLTVT
jgi:uncharacterized cupredoxin-like copper-binding protein